MKLELIETLAVRETPAEGGLVCTPPQVYEKLKDMENLIQEAFVVLLLDSKNQLIRRKLITLGTVSSSLVHPRETFREAIIEGASSIILGHNHPSGDPTPSSEDIRVTKQLINAGEIIGIKVLDHIVIGEDGSYLSLRESGLCKF